MLSDIQQHKDATLRKIGRNVVNFPKMEVALRALILATSAQGTLQDFQTRQVERARSAKKLSLGNLASKFHKGVYEAFDQENAPDSSSEGWLSVSFQAETDPTTAKAKKRALLGLVKERNRLIHSDLARLDLESIESCIDFSAKLDSQNERICNQLEEIKVLRDTHTEALQELLVFINSEEFLAILAAGGDGA